jgi:hypothetical protein
VVLLPAAPRPWRAPARWRSWLRWLCWRYDLHQDIWLPESNRRGEQPGAR